MATLDTVNIPRTRKITADYCVLLTATCKNRPVYAQAKKVYTVALLSCNDTLFCLKLTDSHKSTNHKIIMAKKGL